ncbi:hypothetical protein ACSBR2_036200 [Camellia fascicularis]
MSLQQQPVMVYPNPVTNQPSSHSKESFGAVFIVLAVIVVVSAIACFLGRFCSKRYHRAAKPKQSHMVAKPKEREQGRQQQGHNFHGRDGDIEFGFDKGIPSGKQFGNGEAKVGRQGGNGEIKGQVRFADEGELRGGDYNMA